MTQPDDNFTTAVVIKKWADGDDPVFGLLISPTPMSGTEWERLLATIQATYDDYEFSEEAADDDFPFDTVLCRIAPDLRYDPCPGSVYI